MINKLSTAIAIKKLSLIRNFDTIGKRYKSTYNHLTVISKDINNIKTESSINPTTNTKTENTVTNDSATDYNNVKLDDTFFRDDDAILKSLDNHKTSETNTTKNIEPSTVDNDETSGFISDTHSGTIINSTKDSSHSSSSISTGNDSIIEPITKIEDDFINIIIKSFENFCEWVNNSFMNGNWEALNQIDYSSSFK